jgi:hypothetical protein
LLHTKIDLILDSARGLDNRLDGGIDNLSGVHVDADFVADFVRIDLIVLRCTDVGANTLRRERRVPLDPPGTRSST